MASCINAKTVSFQTRQNHKISNKHYRTYLQWHQVGVQMAGFLDEETLDSVKGIKEDFLNSTP